MVYQCPYKLVYIFEITIESLIAKIIIIWFGYMPNGNPVTWDNPSTPVRYKQLWLLTDQKLPQLRFERTPGIRPLKPVTDNCDS